MIKKLLTGLLTFIALLVTPASAFAATLSFNPAVGTFNRGCNMSVNIELDTTGTQTDGTDVIVIYEPGKLSLTTANITNGTIYPEYPGNSVDATAGKISISGISSVSSPFSGKGTFATLNFKVADNAGAGITTLKFDFDPNNKTKTTDTNVVERGTIADVLNGVTDGSYTIGTGAGCVSSGGAINGGQGQALNGGTASNSSIAKLPNQLQNTGLFDNTIALTAIGAVLVLLGIAGLALL